MEPKLKLNEGITHRRGSKPILFALVIAVSVGSLYGRLAAIYQRPTALPASPIRPTPDHDAPPLRREDADLFERALAAGLLWLGAEGCIGIAPVDLPLRQLYARDHPDLLTPRVGRAEGLNGAWNDRVRSLHRALYFSTSGRYVRQQVEAFNARQPTFTHIQREGRRLVWRDAPLKSPQLAERWVEEETAGGQTVQNPPK
jgi:hypothetical protein